MTGAPTVQVFLDDGTGTYPIDVSSRVLLPAGVTVSSYGRTDEFGQAQAAQLQLVLDNTDGALSVGLGFDTGGFDVGGFDGAGSAVYAGLGIRYKLTKGATTRNRFTGKLLGGVLGWPGGLGSLAEMAITAMDPLADLGTMTLRSMLEQEILLHAPAVYYTLGEPTGSTSAGDTSGRQVPTLNVNGSGLPVVFGTAAGAGVDGLTAAVFQGGQYLSGLQDGQFLSGFRFTPAGGTLLVFMATTAANVGLFGLPNTVSFRVNAAGKIEMFVGTTSVGVSAASVNDGVTREIAWQTGLGGSAGLYIDGVQAIAYPYFAPIPSSVLIGADIVGSANFVGTLSHLAVATLTAADLLTIANAARGFVGETTAQRFARLVAYAGLSSSTTAGMSGQTMGVQATSGKSALEALQEVETAEDGLMYANGSGAIVLQGRGFRAGKTTADLTLPSDALAADTSVAVDNQQQIEQVTASRPGGATQLVGSGLPAIDLELVVDNDGDVLRAAQWIVAKYANPGPRIGSGTYDLFTSPNAEQQMQRDLGDRLGHTGLPSQMWEGAGDVVIEGWSETVTDQSWTQDVNLLPWSLSTALVLDDATYGALDTYPIAN